MDWFLTHLQRNTPSLTKELGITALKGGHKKHSVPILLNSKMYLNFQSFWALPSPLLQPFSLTFPGCGRWACSGQRWGADGYGPGGRAAALMAQPEQREAAGAGEERGEYCVQSGHPLCQPHGLPAGSIGHQQDQASPQRSRHWLGERQQQHRHKQVRSASILK